MLMRSLILALLLVAGSSFAEEAKVRSAVEEALKGLSVAESDDPYSRTIQRMFIGFDENKKVRTGVVYREIDSFKTITGVVVVDFTENGFVLREALFPDVGKIKNAKDRQQVMTVLAQFKNVPFDPHVEKSAVDALSGATRYGIKMSGYLNYLARHVALQMENPPAWAKQK